MSALPRWTLSPISAELLQVIHFASEGVKSWFSTSFNLLTFSPDPVSCSAGYENTNGGLGWRVRCWIPRYVFPEGSGMEGKELRPKSRIQTRLLQELLIVKGHLAWVIPRRKVCEASKSSRDPFNSALKREQPGAWWGSPRGRGLEVLIFLKTFLLKTIDF